MDEMHTEEFDEVSYLMANPDVSVAVKEGQFSNGYEHYMKFGKKEGRPPGAKDLHGRKAKVMAHLDINGLGLEIGPSHNPIAPKREGYKVHIIDHLDKEGLRAKYHGHSGYGVNIENIEDVDFVWKGESLVDLTGMAGKYDWIVASHVIEHLPDVIAFLQECEALLKPNGRLSLVVPDKRYCFDHMNSVTSTGEILDAYHQKRKRPSPGQVFNHFANACKLDDKIAWDSTATGRFSLIHTVDQAKSLWGQIQSTPEYIDVHCWRFTPTSFRLLISDLNLLGLSNLGIYREYDTEGCEFYVTLATKTAGEIHVSHRIDSLLAIISG